MLKRQPQPNLFQELLPKVVRNWYWFLISVVVCLVVAKVYLRWYTVPLYNVECRFLMKRNNNNSGSQGDELSQMNIINNNTDVANEMEILKTRLLMSRTVRKLRLNVCYFTKGRFKSTELYNNAPFVAEEVGGDTGTAGGTWIVSSTADGSHVLLSDEGGQTSVRWGDTVTVKGLSLVFIPRKAGTALQGSYILAIAPEDGVVTSYLSRTKITQAGDGEDVIQMSIADVIPKRGEDVLNTLYDEYTKSNMEDQNSIADNTIEFINNRLSIVHQELSGVEKNIEDFKRTNKLTNLDEQSKMVMNNTDDVNKQLGQQDLQLEILGTVEEQLKSKTNRVVPPSILSADPTYSSLVQHFNTQIMERDAALTTTRPANPIIRVMDAQIDSTKTELLLSLENVRKNVNITKAGLSAQLNRLMGIVEGTPSKERAYLDISREQSVKQQLYLFLLQKREETAISKSGTLANSRLIDPARSDPGPFSPDRRNIYLVALAIGLALPALGLYLRELLNDRVTEKKDIVNHTSAPILGEIGHSGSESVLVVEKGARSLLAEQFRTIRTNLQFMLSTKKHQSILVTSSMGGEGKSFVATNMASSLAMLGKKVALLELDLRKPRLSSVLGMANERGFTNFIVGNEDLKYLPKPVPQCPGLYIVSSGPIPPNPVELLLHDRVQDLFSYLYANFDYVVIDTPPLGLVTDALVIASYADVSLYITRQNFTFKKQVDIIDELYTSRKLNGLCVLFNDARRTGGGYGYGYGYTYGSGGYYSDSEESKKRGIFGKSRKMNGVQ